MRLMLVAVCCDHPAMCRMCGFGDHAHKGLFCSRCHCKLEDLRTKKAMTVDGEYQYSQGSIDTNAKSYTYATANDPRDGEEHRRRAREFRDMEDADKRETYYKEHASRWFELCRLPYFDPVKMAVIDPMHNILLGAY